MHAPPKGDIIFLMYGCVLAAVNEFTNSEASARYAITVAKASNARIIFAFVAEKNTPRKAFERAEEALKRLFLEAAGAGVEAESITEEGEPLRAIGDIVKKEEVGLVFASTRREDIKKRFFVKSVSRALMLGLPCSTAVVRALHMGRIHPKDILVPLKNGMGRMGERAYFISRLAEGFGSKVIVFHSPRPVSGFLGGEVHLRPLEWEGRLPGDLGRFAEDLKRFGIPHEKRVRPGAAGRSITLEAAARRNDLIVMGASQRSILGSFIRGNPVEEVLRITPCDLIIFRPKNKEKKP